MDIIQISPAAARVNANLTQEQVAKELNVSKNTVVNWEKGVSVPKATQAQALSHLYGIPIDNINFLPSKSN